MTFLLLCYSSATSQDIYKSFEVDSAAEPRSGIASFNTFLLTNLRKPILAEAKGVGGVVVIGGIVEPDGHVSNVMVTKSFRPDCDREAIRVFNLFWVWKPALKGGKVVRQQIGMPIVFKPNPPFRYQNGVKINYFDAVNKPVTDSSEASYKQLVPIDTAGLPTGDIVLYKRKETTWKKEARLSFIRKVNTAGIPSAPSVQLIGYQNSNHQWEGDQFSLDKEGNRIHQTFYENGKSVGPELYYYSNGLVEQKIDDFDDKTVSTHWYPTGQIKQVSIETKIKYAALDSTGQVMKLNSPVQVMGFWTSDGQQLVKEGNGQFIRQIKAPSYSDTTKQTQFTEQGLYKNGFKQGTWVGRYADNSYYYADEYDDGFFKKGKACLTATDTVHYTMLEMMPEFQGGLNGLKQFLNQNLRYPANAQRTGAQGQVLVSFVVCADGTLCDYKVVKSVQPDLDREAIRVVKLMNGRWTPCIQRGLKIRMKYTMPINFDLY